MLNLDVCDNQRDVFVVDFYGSNFRSYVSVLKSLPTSKFKPQYKKWFVKVYDYELLLRELAQRQLNSVTSTEPFKELIKSYQGWEARTKEMLALKDADVPEMDALVKLPLMKHQRVACKCLKERKILLLADQMGVGKTLPAIVTAQYLYNEGVIKNCLVICTASAKKNWAKEMEKFLHDPDYVMIEGSQADRVSLYSGEQLFKIVNYDLLRRDIDILDDEDKTYDLVIADEVHRIRNHTALQSKAVIEIGKKATYRWGVTGTPIQNRLKDLYSVMTFVDPNMFGSWFYFDKRYIERGFFGEITGYKNKDEVRDKLSFIMLRRRKEEVLENLPDKVYNTVYVEMPSRQKKMYDAVVDQKISLPNDPDLEDKINDSTPLSRTTYAREVCDSVELIDPRFKDSAKMSALKDLVEDFVEDGRKVVVFTQYAKMAHIIQKNLKQKSLVFHGGVPTPERETMLERFRNETALPLFIMTTAGSESINLQCAEVIIFFDLVFNPQQIAQIEDRLHRQGQKATVNVIRLIAKDTVEDRVLAILDEKKELFDDIVEDEMVISTNQILKLL